MKRSTFWLVFFGITGVAELLAVSMNWTSVQYVAKPLIMLSLVGYFFFSTTARSIYFTMALLFCWAGDVLLLFQDSMAHFFIFGLVAFLIGHMLYIVSYRQFRHGDKSNELLPTQKFRYSLPIILAGTGLIVILYPNLGSLQIPVLVYAVVLMLMVLAALMRFGRTTPTSFWMIFLGAVLFMISDSSLAINKFYAPFENSGLAIMITYIAAQYLIVEGAVQHGISNS